MVLSNYKYMQIRNTEFQDPIPVITSTFQACSSNRIKIQVILLILQLETDYFSSYSFQNLKQWHYSLHRDFQNCILHEEVLQGSSAPILHGYLHTYTSIQRILHPESNSTCRRQRALRVLLLHSKDLPKAFQAFQPQDLPKAFQTFQTFMTFQPIQAILQVPVSPGNPPHSSIFQLECIFYKTIPVRLVSTETPPSTSWTIQTTNITFFKEREML